MAAILSDIKEGFLAKPWFEGLTVPLHWSTVFNLHWHKMTFIEYN